VNSMKKNLINLLFFSLVLGFTHFTEGMEKKIPLHTIYSMANLEDDLFNREWAKLGLNAQSIVARLALKKEFLQKQTTSQSSFNFNKIKTGLLYFLPTTTCTALGLIGAYKFYKSLTDDSGNFETLMKSGLITAGCWYGVTWTFTYGIKGLRSLNKGLRYKSYVTTTLKNIEKCRTKISTANGKLKALAEDFLKTS